MKKVIERIVEGPGAPNENDLWLNGTTLKKFQNGEWVAISGGGEGSASSLSDMTDVGISSPSDGDTLVYNATTHKWENGSGSGGSVPPVMVVEGNVVFAPVESSGHYGFSPKPGEATFQEAIAQLDAGGILYLKADISGMSSGANNYPVYNGRFSIVNYNNRTMYSIVQSDFAGGSYALVWENTISFDIDFESPDAQVEYGPVWFIDYDNDIFDENKIALRISNAPVQDGEAFIALYFSDDDGQYFYGYLDGDDSNSYEVSITDSTTFKDWYDEDIPDGYDYAVVITTHSEGGDDYEPQTYTIQGTVNSNMEFTANAGQMSYSEAFLHYDNGDTIILQFASPATGMTMNETVVSWTNGANTTNGIKWFGDIQ